MAISWLSINRTTAGAGPGSRLHKNIIQAEHGRIEFPCSMRPSRQTPPCAVSIFVEKSVRGILTGNQERSLCVAFRCSCNREYSRLHGETGTRPFFIRYFSSSALSALIISDLKAKVILGVFSSASGFRRYLSQSGRTGDEM